MRSECDLVTRPRIVKARRNVDDEAHLAAHGQHAADDALPVRPAAVRRHEVLDLADPVGHQEASDQHVCVGQVELLGAPAILLGRDPEQAAALGVEDRAEDAR